MSGINRIGRSQAPLLTPLGKSDDGRVPNGVAAASEEGRREAIGRRKGGRCGVRTTTEVTERTLLRGILYAFQVSV